MTSRKKSLTNEMQTDFKFQSDLEIERKFLVATVEMLNLGIYTKTEIISDYVIRKNDFEYRVRKEDDRYLQTIKRGRGLARREFESEITQDYYEQMLKLSLGRVEKTRYHIPYNGNVIDLDIYHGKHQKLLVAEVEFKSEGPAKRFVPPEWFGREVTGVSEYSNAALATQSSQNTLLRGAAASQNQIGLDQGVTMLISTVKMLEAKSTDNIVIQIGGGSSSGKTSMVARKLCEAFNQNAMLISQDDYYIGIKLMEAALKAGKKINFDHPNALQLPLLAYHISELKAGRAIDKPVYSFMTGEREDYKRVEPKKIIIIEGLFGLDAKLVADADICVFVDVGAHGRTIRRLFRDTQRTSWTPIEIMRYMASVVEPMYKSHVEPTMANAHFVITNEYDAQSESSKAGFNEVQLKYRATIDVEKLRKMGAERIMTASQRDYYYVPVSSNFDQTGETLRIRKEGDATILTYKGPNVGTLAMERPKFEFLIDDDIKRALLGIYPKESRIIEKARSVYRYNAIVFTVDTNVSISQEGKRRAIGDFIEVRFPDNNLNSGAVKGLLAALKISDLDKVASSYYDM